MVATFENLCCRLGCCALGLGVFGHGDRHSLEMAQREARPGTVEVGNLRGPRVAHPLQADVPPFLVPYLLLLVGPG